MLSIEFIDKGAYAMEIRQLITFRTLVDTGNYTQTAHLLGYTQSTVSTQIKTLEQDLGAPLFSYRHRQLTLTNTGKRLIPLADHLLTDYQAIQQITTPTILSGPLKIAAPESLTIYQLPPILAEFRQRYPQVQLQLTNATCKYNQQQLIAGEADIAFMLWPTLTTTRLIDHDLGRQPMTGITSIHNTADFDQLSRSQLPFIINEPDCSYRNQFEHQLWQQHHRRPPLMELWSLEAIKQMVASDVGYSYLPTMTVQAAIDHRQLRAIPTSITNEIHAHLLTRQSSQLMPVITAFVDLVKQRWSTPEN